MLTNYPMKIVNRRYTTNAVEERYLKTLTYFIRIPVGILLSDLLDFKFKSVPQLSAVRLPFLCDC